LVLSRVRLIRVRLVLVNLNPINDTYMSSCAFVQKVLRVKCVCGRKDLRLK